MKTSGLKSDPAKAFQVSKEYIAGKWQKVGFFKSETGRITVKPL